MPGATHQVSRVHDASTTALGGNIRYEGMEWRATHEPKSHVYIYNVSARTFPNLGKLGRSVPGVTEDDPFLPGMLESEKYHYVTSFPQPILIARENNEANTLGYIEQDAVRYVVDLINPDNITRTLATKIPENAVYSVGNDLSLKGVFFSESQPPRKEEVRAAIDRMEEYYRVLLERAATLELTDKAKLSEALAGNPDYSFAANYFGKDVAWNRKSTRPVECPNCGEQKPAGRKFHQTSFGSLCIEQTTDAWKAAVNSGVKKYEDVPDDFKWRRVSLVSNEKVEEMSKGTTKIDQLAAQIAPTLTQKVDH